MKKLVITALSILSVFGLSACGNTQTADKEVTTTTSANAVTTVTTASATTSVAEVVTTSPTSTSEDEPIVTTTTSSKAPEVETTTTTKSTTTTVTTKKPVTTTTKKVTTTTKKTTTTTAKKTTTTAPVTSKKEVRTNHAGTVIPDGCKWVFTQEDIDSLVEYAKYYATEVKGLKWDDTLTRENSSWAGDSGFFSSDLYHDYEDAKQCIKEDIDYWADKNYWTEGECYIDTIGLEIDKNTFGKTTLWDFYFLI